jgi:hypothetical protein
MVKNSISGGIAIFRHDDASEEYFRYTLMSAMHKANRRLYLGDNN